jgi:hypothetical protein
MTQLASSLRRSIDVWTDHVWQHSALAQLVRQGALPEHAMALYLESLRYLFQSSQRNLAVAATRARELGHVQLAEVFATKAFEEQGHDQWAKRDLSGLRESATLGVEPAVASRRLVELQCELIELQHPLCFFAYALWAEYMTVRLGDVWLAALASNGYARSAVTSVANHVEADREHAAEGFDVLDQLWQGQPESQLIFHAVQRAQQLFEAFCDEVHRAALNAEQRGVSSHLGSLGPTS